MSRKNRRGPLVRPIVPVVTVFLAAGALRATAAVETYPTIPYKEAAGHMEEIVWVEGTVLRTESAPEGVYLLFSANEKYVRILVPKASVANFQGSLQHKYTGKKVKAVGKVSKYGYKLIVGVNEPKRIQIEDDNAT